MPYHPDDTDANRNNPSTPSHVSLSEQLLYRIASLDATVQQGFRRVDERLDRFQNDLHENQIATNDRINKLDKDVHEQLSFKRGRLDAIEKGIVSQREKDRTEGQKLIDDFNGRMTNVETWQKVVVARIGIVTAALVGLWTFIAPTVRAALGIDNG
jgi:hypothetical protein